MATDDEPEISERKIVGRMLRCTHLSSRAKLAEWFGVPLATIADWEKGALPLHVVRTVAERYGVTLDWLVYGGEDHSAVDAATSQQQTANRVEEMFENPSDAFLVGLANSAMAHLVQDICCRGGSPTISNPVGHVAMFLCALAARHKVMMVPVAHWASSSLVEVAKRD